MDKKRQCCKSKIRVPQCTEQEHSGGKIDVLDPIDCCVEPKDCDKAICEKAESEEGMAMLLQLPP